MQDAGCKMRVAGRGLQVIIESKPHFLTGFSLDIHRASRISSGKTLIDMFIVIFRPLDFSSAKL